MTRLLLLSALVLTSLPAWATGERIVVTPASNPLRDALCISMACVAGGSHDATVTARTAGNSVEFTVTGSSGQVKLVTRAPSSNGQVSSTDLVHAAALVVKAIEGAPAPAPKPAPTAKVAHKAKLKLWAKR